jgi:hypothetical protein
MACFGSTKKAAQTLNELDAVLMPASQLCDILFWFHRPINIELWGQALRRADVRSHIAKSNYCICQDDLPVLTQLHQQCGFTFRVSELGATFYQLDEVI